VVARRIASDIGQKDVLILPDTPAYVENRLRLAGFVTKRCGQEENCFPWVELYGLPNATPCRVTVHWGYVGEALSGVGGHTDFWCVFGLVFEMSEQVDWSS